MGTYGWIAVRKERVSRERRRRICQGKKKKEIIERPFVLVERAPTVDVDRRLREREFDDDEHDGSLCFLFIALKTIACS